MPNSQDLRKYDKTPLVSFIIPTFNTDPTMLRSCIDSIRNLSLSNDSREIIVIDDGSDTPAISTLLDISDDIIYVRQPNQGISRSRNRGIDMAKGKYIQLIDGDDYLLQPTYEHCLDIARYHNPDMIVFDVAYSPSVTITEDIEGPFTGADYMQAHNIRGASWCYIFKKDMLQGLRFRSDMNYYAEDEEFTAQLMLHADRLFATSAKSYFYRQHKASVLHQHDKRSCIQRLENTEKVILHLQEQLNTLPQSKQFALQRRIAQLSMDHLYNTARLTHSLSRLEETCERLRAYGLFPLPEKNYTAKYRVFQRLCKSSWGRRIIIATTLL